MCYQQLETVASRWVDNAFDVMTKRKNSEFLSFG